MKSPEDSKPATRLRRAAEAQVAKDQARRPPRSEADMRRLQHELEVHQVELEMQNEELQAAVEAAEREIVERKRVEQALLESGDYSQALLAASPSAIVTYQATGATLSANAAAVRLVGATIDELKRQNFRQLVSWQRSKLLSMADLALATGRAQSFEEHLVSTFGREFWAECQFVPFLFAGAPHLLLLAHDITERKQAENLSVLSREVLQILNAPGALKPALQAVLEAMKHRTGLDAVGIRLQGGEDFPYFVQSGFSEDFLRTENSLLRRTADGGLCRNPDGSVMLECTCGLVLSGRIHPENPLATPSGSIWTNDAPALLHLPAEADPRLHPRNRCIHQGYASVALVPIRCDARILGLLQFNDRRPQRFSLKAVEQLEEIATHLGLALLRKQAEEALRRSEEKFSRIFKSSPIAMALSTLAEGRLLDVNEELLHFLQRSRGEVIGLGAVELGLWRGPEQRAARLRLMEAQGGIQNMELEFRLASGEIRHALWSAEKLSMGGTDCLLSALLDITERKQAEKLTARLAAIVECSNDAIISKDCAGTIQSWNQGAEVMFGYRAEEMIGVSIRKLIPLDRQSEEDQILEKILAGHSIDHYETLRQSKTGRLIPVSITVSPIKDKAGMIVGASKVIRDITERKQAEEQLKLQASALTAAANAIVITDRHGKIEWVNPAFTKLTGYSAAEALGQNARLLKSGEHPQAFYGTLWATVLTGNVWQGELVNKRKDGKLYTEETTITPVRGEDGDITHFVAVKQDVTERRQMEKRIQQAQKMEAIGTLAGGIAHDFNNVLAAMVGYAHLLKMDTEGNAPAQESVAEILQAVNRAKDLVRQILTFSRQREQKPEIIKLEMVIKETLKFLRASLPAHIQIDMQLAAASPAVLADPTQIYQVIMNLATTALHAMEERPGRLTVALDAVQPEAALRQAYPELKPMLYARVIVADTGHGMDANTLQRIFEPFFTTKPVGKGTGLGLAVVHGIVQAHQGVITVASQVGQGTQFTLYFPAQTQAAPAAAAKAGTVRQGQGQRILLVDDETALTRALRRMLSRLEFQITTSNQAAEAIGWIRENPAQFDVVITDLTMPEMNGLELARQVRAIRPDLPIILMSGYSASVDAERLREAGICERLEKPVLPDVLADMLARVLKLA